MVSAPKQPADRKRSAKKQVTKKQTGRVTPKKSKTPTSVSEWKKAAGLALDLPSGKTALVRNPGMKAFLNAGLIPNSLIPIVTEALERGGPPSAGASKKAAESEEALVEKKLREQLGKDPQLLEQMIEAIDNITVFCVVEPKVHSVPKKEMVKDDGSVELVDDFDAKDPELLYVDEVDFEDKTHIFNWAVGGTRDLERFHK